MGIGEVVLERRSVRARLRPVSSSVPHGGVCCVPLTRVPLLPQASPFGFDG
jgi:hypothetical protein